MVTPTPSSWSVRGASFAVWLLAAASCAYWGLRLTAAPAGPSVAPAPARGAPAIDPAAVARLLGAGAPTATAALPPPPALSSRFSLVGVVAGVQSRDGAAVIAVDGKPAKPYRVGAAIDETLIVQAVQGRQAVLGPKGGPPAVTLELPAVKQLAGARGPLPPTPASAAPE